MSLTNKIYHEFNALYDEASFIVFDSLVKLRNRGFRAESAPELVFNIYGAPWGIPPAERFPALCAIVPFIQHVKLDNPRNNEILLVGVTVSIVKSRDMRFLIYPKARKPRQAFDVVKAENCDTYLRKECAVDVNELGRSSYNVQEAAMPHINASYREITELCNDGEVLLVQKIYAQLFDTLPPPPDQLHIKISDHTVPFYAIFTTKNAKYLFSERCRTKKDRKKSDSVNKLLIKHLMRDRNQGRLRRAI